MTISRSDPAEAKEADPALQPFLQLLADDLARHPQRTRPVEASLVSRVRDLTREVDVDPDAPLAADAS